MRVRGLGHICPQKEVGYGLFRKDRTLGAEKWGVTPCCFRLSLLPLWMILQTIAVSVHLGATEVTRYTGHVTEPYSRQLSWSRQYSDTPHYN